MASAEMHAVVLRMLQQQRMVQLHLEEVVQEMNVLLDEARPPEERIRKALELQYQMLQTLHYQEQIQNQLRLALLRLAVIHGQRDDAVAAAAQQMQREWACSSASWEADSSQWSYGSSANSQALVDTEDAGQQPGSTDENRHRGAAINHWLDD
jgi:hypothetical protein